MIGSRLGLIKGTAIRTNVETGIELSLQAAGGPTLVGYTTEYGWCDYHLIANYMSGPPPFSSQESAEQSSPPRERSPPPPKAPTAGAARAATAAAAQEQSTLPEQLIRRHRWRSRSTVAARSEGDDFHDEVLGLSSPPHTHLPPGGPRVRES